MYRGLIAQNSATQRADIHKKHGGKFKLKGLLNICLCARFTYHQNSVQVRTVLQLKRFWHKKCSALIGSSIWSSISPAFIHMSSHIPNGCDSLISLKINDEVLWNRREFKMDPTQMFHALQNSLASINYKLNSSSEVRNTESNWATHS